MSVVEEWRLEEAALERARRRELVARARREWWVEFEREHGVLCSLVDEGKLRFPGAFSEVLGWCPTGGGLPTGNGLLLAGRTGVGKSRSLAALVRRLVCVDNIWVEWIDDWRFGPMAVGAARDGCEDEFVERLVRARVLVWDDFGKCRMTPAVESAVMAVVAGRCDAGRPLLVSTQFGPAELVRRFREVETGEAVARRIEEFCGLVRFS